MATSVVAGMGHGDCSAVSTFNRPQQQQQQQQQLATLSQKHAARTTFCTRNHCQAGVNRKCQGGRGRDRGDKVPG